jgi:gamma-glutamyltranspeptidase / glutathione hydrolase
MSRRLSSPFSSPVFLLCVALVSCGADRAAPVAAPVVPAPPPVLVPLSSASEAKPPRLFPEAWPYPAHGPTVRASKGMVVSDAELATKVGRDVLAAGGNAVDAAVAMAFALAVVLPTAGNIGGGGFMVARVGDAPYALDFREVAPHAAKHDMYLGKDGKPNGASRGGYKASGVPGSVEGLWEAFQKLGSKTKTWAELLAPAIHLASDGFYIGGALAESIRNSQDNLKKYPGSSAIYVPNGAPLEKGALLRNPDLAATLKRVADKGPKGFYEGQTADLVAAEMKRGEGLITREDLKAYKAKWRTPIELDYRGHHLTAMPPPSSGGVTLGMICHILSGYELGKEAWHSPRALHLTFEAMRRAFLARNAKLGDPDFVINPTETLLSEAWATSQRATIREEKATPTTELAPELAAHEDGPHTTHFAVVDAEGNAVGVTTTLNWWFGSGVTVTGAGFVMNNEMDDFATVPGTANGFGLVQAEPNAIAPGKRMLSSMSPTVVTASDGKLELVLGAAGGPAIITTVFEILSDVVDFGLDVTTAVNAPRFHQQDLPDVVMFEKDGLEDALKAELTSMGYTFKERSHIADAPAIGHDGAELVGAAEPRRSGGLGAGW